MSDKITPETYQLIAEKLGVNSNAIHLFPRGKNEKERLFLVGMNNNNPVSDRFIRNCCDMVVTESGRKVKPGNYLVKEFFLDGQNLESVYRKIQQDKFILDLQVPGTRISVDSHGNIFCFDDPKKYQFLLDGEDSLIRPPEEGIDTYVVTLEEKASYRSIALGRKFPAVKKLGHWNKKLHWTQHPLIIWPETSKEDGSPSDPEVIKIDLNLFVQAILNGEIVVAYNPKTGETHEYMLRQCNRWFWQFELKTKGNPRVIENLNAEMQAWILLKEARADKAFDFPLSTEEIRRICAEVNSFVKDDSAQAGEQTPHVLLKWFAVTCDFRKPEIAEIVASIVNRESITINWIEEYSADHQSADTGDSQVDKTLNRIFKCVRDRVAQGRGDYPTILRSVILNEKGYTWYRLVKYANGEIEDILE